MAGGARPGPQPAARRLVRDGDHRGRDRRGVALRPLHRGVAAAGAASGRRSGRCGPGGGGQSCSADLRHGPGRRHRANRGDIRAGHAAPGSGRQHAGPAGPDDRGPGLVARRRASSRPGPMPAAADPGRGHLPATVRPGRRPRGAAAVYRVSVRVPAGVRDHPRRYRVADGGDRSGHRGRDRRQGRRIPQHQQPGATADPAILRGPGAPAGRPGPRGVRRAWPARQPPPVPPQDPAGRGHPADRRSARRSWRRAGRFSRGPAASGAVRLLAGHGQPGSFRRGARPLTAARGPAGTGPGDPGQPAGRPM